MFHFCSILTQDDTWYSCTTPPYQDTIHQAVRLPQSPLKHNHLHSWLLVHHSAMGMIHTITIKHVWVTVFVLFYSNKMVHGMQTTFTHVHRVHMAYAFPSFLLGQWLTETYTRSFPCQTIMVHMSRSATWLHFVHEIAVPISRSSRRCWGSLHGIGQNAPHTVGDLPSLVIFQGNVVHWL